MSAAATSEPDPEEGARLLRELDAHFSALRGLEADFIQIWRPGRFGGEVEEKGTLWIRKPGMARWEYFEPEHKLALVTPDKETWFYEPTEEQAVRGRLPDPLPPHLLLLFGKADLEANFHVEELRLGEPEASAAELAVLVLVPEVRTATTQKIILTVERAPIRLASIAVVGAGGEQTEYIFLNLQEDRVAPEALFRFTPPEGVSVLEERPDTP